MNKGPRCWVCRDTGTVVRKGRGIDLNTGEVIGYHDGIDACPACTQRAEQEYRLWKEGTKKSAGPRRDRRDRICEAAFGQAARTGPQPSLNVFFR